MVVITARQEIKKAAKVVCNALGVSLLLGACETSKIISHSQGIDGGNLASCSGEYDAKAWHWCTGNVTWKNGDIYTGEFRNGLPNGRGTWIFSTDGELSGEKYIGEWRNDFSHGWGTYFFANGEKFLGEWKDGKRQGQGILYNPDGSIKVQGIWEEKELKAIQKIEVSPRLKYILANPKNQEQAKLRPDKPLKKNKQSQVFSKPITSGSGFFISRSGEVLTNQHIVRDCKKVTIGHNMRNQVVSGILETDRKNDLALLKVSSLKKFAPETKSLIQKLGIEILPFAPQGLLRSQDVKLGEDILVAGYPYGEFFSDTIKVTKGIVSSGEGMGGDDGQFQIDAAAQPGNSGGPIYDGSGNIVGVVISQLNKMKFAKHSGSIPENVNFGIKASTVRQFLRASGVPNRGSKKTSPISTQQLAKIAKKQTVMVMCHR